MWRALFLALGIYCILLGAQCLAVERAILKSDAPAQGGLLGVMRAPAPRELVPPDWAAWTLLSGGAVTVLYSFTIPRRAGGAG